MYGWKASGEKLKCRSPLSKDDDLLRGFHSLASILSDFLCLDFFLWSHIKSVIKERPIETDMDLLDRIAVVTGNIQEMLNVSANFCTLTNFTLCIWIRSDMRTFSSNTYFRLTLSTLRAELTVL